MPDYCEYFGALFYILDSHVFIGRKIEEGKIIFKKPIKRKDQHSEEETAEKRRYKEEVKEVVTSNSRLLSFNDEEDNS